MTTQTLSARLVKSGEGPTYRVVTDLVTFKAIADQTGGAYSLFETCTAPGQGTPPHLQHYEDEAFLVLEGTYTFLIGEQKAELRPGDHAFVPRKTVHAFTNSGSTPARMLILVSPGGIHEKFFAEAGQLIPDRANPPSPNGSFDPGHLVAVAQKYGIEILPPSS